MKTARDIMTSKVISVTPTASISEVARTLNENGISGCPVIDFSGHLRGVISRTNLLDHVMSAEGDHMEPMLRLLVPGTSSDEDVLAPVNLDDIPQVQDVMTSDVIAVSPSMPLFKVAAIMSGERIHRVPVVDGDRVVGIITALDVLGAFPGT
jgi:CBS domain-containing protein